MEARALLKLTLFGTGVNEPQLGLDWEANTGEEMALTRDPPEWRLKDQEWGQ